MDAAKKAKLLAAGYTTGTVAEFLQLSPYETEIIETRIALTNMVRKLRTEGHITQADLAARLHSGQSRIAKMEASDPSVSLDFILKALYTLGADRRQVAEAIAA